MFRFIIKALRPPTLAEWTTHWKGIAAGGAFAFLLFVVGEDHGILDAVFAYVITFLSLIASRIAASERSR